jgi:hypothetical protein
LNAGNIVFPTLSTTVFEATIRISGLFVLFMFYTGGASESSLWFSRALSVQDLPADQRLSSVFDALAYAWRRHTRRLDVPGLPAWQRNMGSHGS